MTNFFCELGDRLRPQILNNYVSSLIPKKYIYFFKLNKSNLQLEPKNTKQKCLKKKNGKDGPNLRVINYIQYIWKCNSLLTWGWNLSLSLSLNKREQNIKIPQKINSNIIFLVHIGDRKFLFLIFLCICYHLIWFSSHLLICHSIASFRSVWDFEIFSQICCFIRSLDCLCFFGTNEWCV